MPIGPPAPYLANNPYSAPSYYYPLQLGQEGEEPYTIFDIRDGVAKERPSKGTIALNLPASITTSYGATYKEENFPYWDLISDIGKAGIMDAYKNQGIGAAISKAGGELLNAGKVAVEMTAVNASAILQRELRMIVNPHASMLFQGMSFRRFTLDYQLTAKNPQESEMIKNIIFTFKYHMHPSFPEGDTGSRWLYYPDEFVIGFFTPADDQIFKISRCALTNVSVDYTGGGAVAFFEGTGAPVDVKLSLAFQELELLTRERVRAGY